VTVSGLSANTSYQFQVAARAGQTNGAFATAVAATTLSGITGVPTALAVGAVALKAIPLTWTAPSTLNGGTISDYVVQYRAGSAGTWVTFTDAVSATTGATVSGLSANTSYQFQVAARTAQGTSAFATAITASTLSGITSAPRSLAAGTVALTSIPLTWTSPLTLHGGAVTDYLVQYRVGSAGTWVTFADAVSTATSVTVSGLSANTGYQFQVAARTAQGNSAYAAAVSATTLSGIASAPTALAVGAVALKAIPLTWTAPLTLNGGTITDYVIQYRVGSTGTWLTFADAVSVTTGVTVTGLTAKTSYQFQVAARTVQGTGAFATAITASTLSGITSAPRTPAAGATTTGTVALTWAAPLTLNGGTITDYVVQYRVGTAGTWVAFAHTASTATSMTVLALAPNTSYQFQIAARTAQGTGAFASAITATTLSGITSAPRSLAAGTATRISVPLTWAAPLTLNGGVVTDYRVQYRLATSTTWLTFTDAVSATTGATVTGLTANRSYQFQVSAHTIQGDSVYTTVLLKSTRR
jgi:chitodextrinase